jgi:hypothetical protein
MTLQGAVAAETIREALLSEIDRKEHEVERKYPVPSKSRYTQLMRMTEQEGYKLALEDMRTIVKRVCVE